MKLSTVAIFVAALIGGAFAKPAGLILGYQDTLGQYSFGYSAPYQARSEARSLDGITRGSYSYVDPAGLVQSTDYIADGENGFRVAATNLPQAPAPVQETPEVRAARIAHLLAVEEAAKGVQTPQESDSVVITAEPKSAEKETQTEEQTGVEPVPEAAEQAPEAQMSEEAIVEAATPEVQQNDKVAEDAGVPSLPVPSIPVNFDLPAISAYSTRSAGPKADETLPQSAPSQGAITPAGTTLKTLTVPQLVAVAPQIVSGGEPAADGAKASESGSARDFGHYERARAVFAPVAPVNVIPVGYDPTVSSFLRYAPVPYVTYNIW